MGRVVALVALVAALMGGAFGFFLHDPIGATLTRPASAADTCQTFKETGKGVCGVFLIYWREHGGLAQQGLPLSDEMNERSDIDGKTYKVQYFERAVFEYHPENQPPYDVLLGLVGREKYQGKYGPPAAVPPAIVGQTVNANNNICCSPLLMRIQVLDLKDNVVLTRDGRPVTPRGKFVAVFIRVTNLGKTTGSMSYGSLILVDRNNRQSFASAYDGTPAAASFFNTHYYNSVIEPGLSDDQVLVFDTLPDATEFRLVVASAYQPK